MRALYPLLLTGCITTVAGGAGVYTNGRAGGTSIEAGGTAGIGGVSEAESTAASVQVAASVGPTTGGAAEVHVAERIEVESFDRHGGWQLAIVLGDSWGGYQDNDLLVGLSGGRRFNLTTTLKDDSIRTVDLSLDATIGAAWHLSDPLSATRDGAFAGLVATIRRDTRYLAPHSGWKPFD